MVLHPFAVHWEVQNPHLGCIPTLFAEVEISSQAKSQQPCWVIEDQLPLPNYTHASRCLIGGCRVGSAFVCCPPGGPEPSSWLDSDIIVCRICDFFASRKAATMGDRGPVASPKLYTCFMCYPSNTYIPIHILS